MEEQIQDAASQMIGKYVWMFISGMLFLLFKSSMESMIEGFKVFIGDDLNTITGKKNMNGGIKFVDRRKHNQIGKNEFLELLTFQL